MHIIQALKMACKSLWSNKLRSFLTMLGIIIGVVTVALLTSVASGVSNAVVSSVRSQSTLGMFMNMNDGITYSKANSVIAGVQSQYGKDSDEYFEYALSISSESVVIPSNAVGETIDEDYFLFDPAFTVTENVSEDEEIFVEMFKSALARSRAMGTSIKAVTSNYSEVYDMDINGKFPTNADEILVDEEFLETYLPDETLESVIGKEITLGVQVKTDVVLTFLQAQTDESVETAMLKLSKSFSNIEILNISADNKTITIRVNYFRNLNNETAKTGLQTILNVVDENNPVDPEILELLELESASLTDFYDSTNAEVFKIVGTIKEDDSSVFSSMTNTSSSEMMQGLNQITLMLALSDYKKGEIYMLASDDIKGVLGIAEDSSIESTKLNMAYFRFKTESVMEKVINKISVAFAVPPNNFIMMKDYMMVSMSSVASIISSIMGIMTTMLTVISVISLVVGGIGIMNIMLVAVTERTREIGIRKAIGAKRSAILVQFLVEALMLSLIGGLIGLGISAIGCLLIGNAMGIAIGMPFWVIAMSLGFCTAIGLIFGMFPAIKAARMQPIDALRRD